MQKCDARTKVYSLLSGDETSFSCEASLPIMADTHVATGCGHNNVISALSTWEKCSIACLHNLHNNTTKHNMSTEDLLKGTFARIIARFVFKDVDDPEEMVAMMAYIHMYERFLRLSPIGRCRKQCFGDHEFNSPISEQGSNASIRGRMFAWTQTLEDVRPRH